MIQSVLYLLNSEGNQTLNEMNHNVLG